MPENTDPVRKRDRLLLHPTVTGLLELAWAEVEVVDHVEDPTLLPWNAGADYPYRVGYRIAAGDETIRRGVLWLDVDGHDPVVALRRIDTAGTAHS